MRLPALAIALSTAIATNPGVSDAGSRIALVCDRLKAIDDESPDYYGAVRYALIGSESFDEVIHWIEDSQAPEILEGIRNCMGLNVPSLSPRQTRLVELLSVTQVLTYAELARLKKYKGWVSYFTNDLASFKGAMALIRENGKVRPIEGYKWSSSAVEANIAGTLLIAYFIEQARICLEWLPHGGEATCQALRMDATLNAIRIAASMVAILTDRNCAHLATMWGINVPGLIQELLAYRLSDKPFELVVILHGHLMSVGGVSRGSEMWKFLEVNSRQFR